VQFTSTHPLARGRVLVAAAMVLGLIVAFAAALAAEAGAAKAKKPKSNVVRVMTRNLYLGADLAPAIDAPSPGEFAAANGQILRDVDTNNYPVRARGLAKEIISKNPDLVGLQEVAMWRTNETPNLGPALNGDPKTATTVKYDFLKTLMNRLNRGKKRYRIVKVQQEFDFEAPGDYNNTPGDSDGGSTEMLLMPDAEMNGRLTMRDAILAKVGARVVTRNAKSGTFKNLYTPTVSGIPVPVTRGWVSVDAKVRGSRLFRFVDTHLEAFENDAKEKQAKELIKRGGPARSGLPVILVGDLNSDDNTVSATNGDRRAYLAIKRFGFRDVATENPMSCCINSSILTDNFGAVSDFDHHIDHILTDTPRKVKRLSAAVTGRQPQNGFWNSDHAGVFSKLRIFR
jgi:endonuclease/exonuclease/phosphatase family metal-dependent hydrolase